MAWNTDSLEDADWNRFLHYLRGLHGAAYLYNPDGDPLALVSPDGIACGFAIATAPTYTRRSISPVEEEETDDVGTQNRASKKQVGTSGANLLRIKRALRDGQMTVREMSDATGIEYDAIRYALRANRGFVKTARGDGRAYYYRLAG